MPPVNFTISSQVIRERERDGKRDCVCVCVCVKQTGPDSSVARFLTHPLKSSRQKRAGSIALEPAPMATRTRKPVPEHETTRFNTRGQQSRDPERRSGLRILLFMTCVKTSMRNTGVFACASRVNSEKIKPLKCSTGQKAI